MEGFQEVEVELDFPFNKQYGDKEFIIDIAQNDQQRDAVYALRYQIFNQELHQGLVSSEATERDQDKYDIYCEHLIIIDAATNEIVGTYRLHRCDRADSKGYYSSGEFDLTNLTNANLRMLEIGRACIRPEYRDGSVMNVLWYGLSRYMRLNKFEYLCGCASLEKGSSAELASLIYAYAREKNAITSEAMRVYANAENKVAGFDPDLQIQDMMQVKRQIPALLRGYFAIQCKIAGEPAYDPEFDVIDFFVMFGYEDLLQGPAKRYFC